MIIAVVLWSLLIGFVAYGFIVSHKAKKELVANPVYTTAIVVEKYTGYRGKHYMKYEFSADGNLYKGDAGYMSHLEIISLGDTCEIMYAKTNPEINEVLKFGDFGYLKIRPKKRLWEQEMPASLKTDSMGIIRLR